MDNDDWKIIARIQRDSNNEVIVKSGKYWKLDVEQGYREYMLFCKELKFIFKTTTTMLLSM